MRIGISVSSSHPKVSARVAMQHMSERARAARLADLDSLFVGDHHVTPFTYAQNNPILGRMLAEWGSKPFGALYLLPLWHPVLLAEQVATLANIGQGRFIMQCGLGDKHQMSAMGFDPSQRVPMFEACLGHLRQLWAGASVSASEHWLLQDAKIAPLPPETVEVWVGSLVPAAIDRTARVAEGWLASPSLTPPDAADSANRYRQSCAEHSRTPTAVAIRRDMYVGQSMEEARRITQPYISKGYRGIDESALLIGGPQEVAQQIQQLADQGYTDVIVRNISSDQRQCLASIERLSEVKALLRNR